YLPAPGSRRQPTMEDYAGLSSGLGPPSLHRTDKVPMIEAFTYQSQPMRVRFGNGTVDAVPDELALHRFARAFVLCTGSSRAAAERLQALTPDRIADIQQLETAG